jgi:hypothetical protein
MPPHRAQPSQEANISVCPTRNSGNIWNRDILSLLNNILATTVYVYVAFNCIKGNVSQIFDWLNGLLAAGKVPLAIYYFCFNP